MANINNEKCCTCTTPEITIKLNKQGPQGLTGPKGEDGFSPIVEVAENTYTTYTLNITDAEKTITTPNLKSTIPSGGQPGDVLTKSTTEDGVYDWQSLPLATQSNKGIIQVATLSDFEIDEEEGELGEGGYTHAVTPYLLENYLSTNFPKPENIVLTTNVDQEIAGYKQFTDSQIKLSPRVFGVNYINDVDGNYWFQHFPSAEDINSSDHFGHPLNDTVLEGAKLTWKNPQNTTEYKVITELDKATTTTLGLVKPDGTTITIDNDGTIHSQSGTSYELPIASSSVLGGIKVGNNLSIDDDGVLSADAQEIDTTKLVTTDTEQTISGQKTFTGGVVSDVLRGENNRDITKFFESTLYVGDTNVPVVIQGSNISTFFPNAGAFKDQAGNKYLTEANLETATTTRLGLIKVGDNLTIEADGTLSAISQGPSGEATASDSYTSTDGTITTVTGTLKLSPQVTAGDKESTSSALVTYDVRTVVEDGDLVVSDTSTTATFDLSNIMNRLKALEKMINGGDASNPDAPLPISGARESYSIGINDGLKAQKITTTIKEVNQ